MDIQQQNFFGFFFFQKIDDLVSFFYKFQVSPRFFDLEILT